MSQQIQPPAIMSPPKSRQNAPLAHETAKSTHHLLAGPIREISLKQASAFSTSQPLSATSQLIWLSRVIFSKLTTGLDVDSVNTLLRFSSLSLITRLTWRGMIVMSAESFHVAAIRPTFCSNRAQVAPLRNNKAE